MLNEVQEKLRKTFTLNAIVKWGKRSKWFLIFFVAPLLIGTLYFSFLASDRYVSESRFVIKNPNQRPSQISTLANLIQTTGLSAGQEEGQAVIEYLRSRSALANLSTNFNFRKNYSDQKADSFSRFPSLFDDDSFEDLYLYYRKVVTVRIEPDTGVIGLRVWAFNPRDARDVNERLLLQSEALVNQLSKGPQSKIIAEAENRVALAEARLSKARVAMRQFRNSESLLDPSKEAAGVLDIANQLIVEQAVARAQLEQMERVVPSNPSIPALRQKIASLETQINRQGGRAVGTKEGIASKLGDYERLAAEQEFSQQMLSVAKGALEQARLESQKQQFYLERVVEPNLPDAPILPERLRQIFALAGSLLCLYLVGWMLITGILEHRQLD